MVAYTKAQIRRLIRLDFVRFCVVGGTGFVINLVALTLFFQLFGLPIFIAQLLAAEIALFSNFMLHHHWTYKAAKVNKSIQKLAFQFHLTSWPAILGSAAMVTAGHELLNLSNFYALVFSSAIALFWNFGWSKYVIWSGVTKAEVERIAG